MEARGGMKKSEGRATKWMRVIERRRDEVGREGNV
jgi:hypothetical protein